MEELKTLTESVEQLLNTNRGGDKGIHGFIGERAHVYITNAWGLMYGEVKVCELIDDQEKRQEMGKAALKASQKYQPDNIMSKWNELIEKTHPQASTYSDVINIGFPPIKGGE